VSQHSWWDYGQICPHLLVRMGVLDVSQWPHAYCMSRHRVGCKWLPSRLAIQISSSTSTQHGVCNSSPLSQSHTGLQAQQRLSSNWHTTTAISSCLQPLGLLRAHKRRHNMISHCAVHPHLKLFCFAACSSNLQPALVLHMQQLPRQLCSNTQHTWRHTAQHGTGWPWFICQAYALLAPSSHIRKQGLRQSGKRTTLLHRPPCLTHVAIKNSRNYCTVEAAVVLALHTNTSNTHLLLMTQQLQACW
jgi:hypothetical protein